MISRVTP